jgi:hypothetical protein
MNRLVSSFMFVVLGSAMASAADYEMDCRLGKGDPKGTREAGMLKTVAAPQLVVKSGETATVLIGGEVRIGGRMLPVGQEVEVTATAGDSGAIHVKAVLRIHTKAGGAAPQVATVSEEVNATIQPGGIVRVEIGKDPKDRQWADVTVRKMK